MAVFFERSYAFYVRSGQFRGQTSPLLPLTPSSLDNLVSFISERSWFLLPFFGPTAWCVASKGSTDPHHLSHIYLNSDQSSHVEPSGRRLGLPQGESLPVFPDEERPLGRERERERNSCLVRVNIVTRRVSLLPIPKQTIPIRRWFALKYISGTKEYEMRNGKPALFTDCTRECKAGAPRRICYYRFVMELYQVMGVACGNCSEGVMSDCLRPQCVTADGIPRGFLSIERMLESPSINVCKNDRIVVDLILMAHGFQECIHWHGLLQEGSQYYDGVPMLTQCAVQFPDSFRCPKSEEVNSHLYDYDHPNHTLSVTGWTHRPTTMDHHPGVVNRFSGIPSNLLFNGKGQYTSPDGITTRTPLAKFIVKRGKRYRFRFINSSSFICQIQIFIEDHNMTIIATDGEPCEPRTVDSIITSPGVAHLQCIIHLVLSAFTDITGQLYQGLTTMSVSDPKSVFPSMVLYGNSSISLTWSYLTRKQAISRVSRCLVNPLPTRAAGLETTFKRCAGKLRCDGKEWVWIATAPL
uniref:Uncharacterized protein n=1 Tax=Timema bartmani TaxID=61472 RepID=A0A7R9HZ96_9NEOP|nr:unnamed protein product [Timema bartmani]